MGDIFLMLPVVRCKYTEKNGAQMAFFVTRVIGTYDFSVHLTGDLLECSMKTVTATLYTVSKQLELRTESKKSTDINYVYFTCVFFFKKRITKERTTINKLPWRHPLSRKAQQTYFLSWRNPLILLHV